MVVMSHRVVDLDIFRHFFFRHFKHFFARYRAYLVAKCKVLSRWL